MSNSTTETRSVVVERDIAHAPEKLWRALTQPHLIDEWLMKNDFAPRVGHRFNLRGEWGGVLDCEVLVVEPNRTLSYTWNFAHDDAAYNHAKHADQDRFNERRERIEDRFNFFVPEVRHLLKHRIDLAGRFTGTHHAHEHRRENRLTGHRIGQVIALLDVG